MKHLLIVAVIIATSITAIAQTGNNLTLSLGGELGAATGNLNDAKNIPSYSMVVGITGQVDLAMDKDAALTFNTGLVEFIGKKIDNSIKNNSVLTITLLVGVKYYFTPVIYGCAQLGSTVITSGLLKGSKFTYIPGLGFKLDKNIDFLVKYTGLSDTGGIFGARVAYVF